MTDPLMKFTCWAESRDAARSVVGAVSEMIAPEPEAVTEFEAKGGGYEVAAYFRDAVELETVTRELRHIDGIRDFALAAVPDENWVAISQAALPPVEAGRFVVYGSHDRTKVGHKLNALEIEAGEAFGTAHHATTLGCLEALDRLVRKRPYGRVLDLGCGSGVLALGAARLLPEAQIFASDYDAIATEVAAENARANRLGRRIHFVTAPGLRHPKLRAPQAFDLILANILARPLMRLAPELKRAIAPRGTVVLSGILSVEARDVIAAYTAQAFRLDERRDIAGWSTLTFTPR